MPQTLYQDWSTLVLQVGLHQVEGGSTAVVPEPSACSVFISKQISKSIEPYYGIAATIKHCAYFCCSLIAKIVLS